MMGLVSTYEEEGGPESSLSVSLSLPVSLPREGTVRRWLSASQEEGFYQELNEVHLNFGWISHLQNCEK